MNSKWYISTLIILLAFIGLNQEQTKVANQQIVLQFSDAEKTSFTAHEQVLATITERLAVLGIASVEISKNDGKHLSIRYYSAIDAEKVGEFLSQDSGLLVVHDDFDHVPFDFPEDGLPENFSLIVSDLQHPSDDIAGLFGKLAPESSRDYELFVNPLGGGQSTSSTVFAGYFAVANKIYSVQKVDKENTSHIFPEVRAGPNA